MSADEDGADPILDAIQTVFGGMPIEYVVVANVLDDTGDTQICCDTHENQRNSTTLGLLSWGTAIEQRRAQQAWEEDQ